MKEEPYQEQGVTVNLFCDMRGNGPWLYCWHGVNVMPGKELSAQDNENMVLAIQLERNLRDKFIRSAKIDYPAAVQDVRSVIAALNSSIPVTILDRGIEH